VIRGAAYWAKVLGAPRLNNFGQKQWSIEVEPDEKGLALLKEIGLLKRLKDPQEGDQHKAPFLRFTQNDTKADGTPADPIRVVDASDPPQAWGKSNGLIGNESVVDAKFVVKDYGPGKQKGVYIRAIRVLDLVPYVVQEFAPLSSDDEFFAGGDDEIARLPEGLEPEVDDDLNDDVPE
jgi:hypothetical protein